jgi:hypothetical protein
MRSSRLLLKGLLIVLLAALPARADTPLDPLRLIPEHADLIVSVPQPSRLFDAYTTLAPVQSFLDLQPVREYYDSTNVRRFYQLVAYLEKELGGQWPDLVDRLAGNGVVVAAKFGPEPAPVLLVIQGKNEALTSRFAQIALQIAEQEIARQEGKDRPEKGTYRGLETIHIGAKFHAATAGAALLVSNTESTLHQALDLSLDGSQKSLCGNSELADARKLLPPDPLANVWLNLEIVRKAPQAKDVFALPRNDANLTVLAGGLLDVVGRAPYLAAGLYRQGNGLALTFGMPRGREGMPEALTVHVPPTGVPGSRPLLEPKGVIYSSSSYLDLSQFWDQRGKLFTEKQIEGFEEFEKNSGRFLGGTRLSQLFQQAGAYQRLIVANQASPGYKTKPHQGIPGFALVLEMRDPEGFTKTVDPILRTIALLTGQSAKLKLVEEKQGETTIVGYRFPEDRKLKGDDTDFRFNFSPAFASVGNQFIASSTFELARDLVGLLEKEAKNSLSASNPLTSHSKVYAEGGAEYLQGIEDFLLTQTILDQAVPPTSAREQVKALIAWVRQLGVLETSVNYGPQDFRFEVRLTPTR